MLIDRKDNKTVSCETTYTDYCTYIHRMICFGIMISKICLFFQTNQRKLVERVPFCFFLLVSQCVNSYITFVYNWIYFWNILIFFCFLWEKWYSDDRLNYEEILSFSLSFFFFIAYKGVIKSIINIQECHFMFIHPSLLCKIVIFVSTSNEWIHHWHNMQLSR